jgi:hypothetical protein
MVWYVIAQTRDEKANKVEEKVVCTITASDISEAQRRVQQIWPGPEFRLRVTDKLPVTMPTTPKT